MFGSILGGLGSILGGVFGRSAADDNKDAQFHFANNGIQMRVKDAEKAGIHPLYALGAQTPQFQPVSTDWASDMGQGLSQLGQSADDFLKRGTSAEGKFGATMQALSVERGQLENDLLRSQIARLNSTGMATPFANNPAMEGQGNSGLVTPQPAQPTVANPAAPSEVPGAFTDIQWHRTTDGGWAALPSDNMKQGIEDSPMEYQWFFRNGIFPNMQPPEPPKKGHFWFFNPLTGQYRQYRKFHWGLPSSDPARN